jgi:heterodisulfide reductase subunit A
VLFVRYELDQKPEVTSDKKGLSVRAIEPALGESISLKPDLLVLSPAIVPNDNQELARILGVELTEDGFFKEAEVKFRPVDFPQEGIFVCGLAHSPRDVTETIAQAQAAAQRAVRLLSRGELASGRLVSQVNERRCSRCELCIAACPYDARVKDPERGVIIVREALCQGCGACVAACPNGAATLRGLQDKQVFSMLESAL